MSNEQPHKTKIFSRFFIFTARGILNSFVSWHENTFQFRGKIKFNFLLCRSACLFLLLKEWLADGTMRQKSLSQPINVSIPSEWKSLTKSTNTTSVRWKSINFNLWLWLKSCTTLHNCPSFFNQGNFIIRFIKLRNRFGACVTIFSTMHLTHSLFT